jgi:uncharacterized membrane protein
MESNPRSTATIAGHPIHAILVPFPIVCFIGTLLCDTLFWRTRDLGWFTATPWLLGIGLGFAALAAIAGTIDIAGERRVRELRTVWLHAGGNVLVVLTELANFLLRYQNGASVVVPSGLMLSLVSSALLLLTGWLGGELVFQHRIGVRDTPLGDEDTEMRVPPRREPDQPTVH